MSYKMIFRRYLFYKILAPFLVMTFGMVTVISMINLVRFIHLITNNGASIVIFAKILFNMLPSLLLILLAVSLFFAIMIIYGKMRHIHELGALQNAGASRIALATPPILLAVIATCLCYFISLYWLPFASRQIKILQNEVISNYATSLITEQQFKQIGQNSIYIDRINPDHSMSLVAVKTHNEEGGKVDLFITAQSAKLIQDDNELMLTLYNGNIQDFADGGGGKGSIFFGSYMMSLIATTQIPAMSWTKMQQFYPDDLLALLFNENTKKMRWQVYAEIVQRITLPALPLMLAIIAIIAITGGQYSRTGFAKRFLVASISAAIVVAVIIILTNKLPNNENIPLIVFVAIVPWLFIISGIYTIAKLK